MISTAIINIFALILSLFIIGLNLFSNNSLTFPIFKNLIYDNIIIIIFVVVVSSISLYLYEIDNRYYKRKSNLISISIFKIISKVIHFTTIVIVCDSILIENFLNLEFHDNPLFTNIGISISSIAISLFISSKISLGNNYSPCYDQRKPKNITSSGLYKYVRHPIYSSNILLLIGALLISGSYLMLINIFIISFFYVVSAYREEKYLINNFSYYSSYSKKTGMFIPKYRK